MARILFCATLFISGICSADEVNGTVRGMGGGLKGATVYILNEEMRCDCTNSDVEISNGETKPLVVVAKANSPFVFKNFDRAGYNLHLQKLDGGYVNIAMPPASGGRAALSRPVSIPYSGAATQVRDDYRQIEGFVISVGCPASAVSGEKGEFRLPLGSNIPPEIKLGAFHPVYGVGSATFQATNLQQITLTVTNTKTLKRSANSYR